MYDVIVVGARVAGSPLAMLLARKGYRVLVVDRARFPSDVISTHGIQLGGIAKLNQWGLLDRVRATGAPSTGVSTIHLANGTNIVAPPDPDVPDGLSYSPRRHLLDKMLLDAAVEAGAEVREEFTVEDLLFEGERVVGIRGRSRGGVVVEERARIVVGADGKHSFVARRVGAQAFRDREPMTMAYYSYYSGVGLTDTDLYVHPDAAVYGWPTNDGLSIMGIMRPRRDKEWYRADIEANMMRDFEMLMPEWAERMGGRREERISGSVDTPNFFRQAYGPGWVLAGDAGHTKDPITAFGITDAFRAADAVAIAIDDGFSGRRPLEEALADYQRTRDEKALPLYQFTLQLASFPEARTQEEVLVSKLAAAAA